MFDITPTQFYEEIRAAENHVQTHITATRDMVRDYHGKYYRSDKGGDLAPAPENHAFEWLSLVTPRIIYDNPTVMISSRFSGVSPDILLKLQHGINQWAGAQRLWKTLLRVWYDAAFSFGVVRTSLANMPGYRGFPSEFGQRIQPQWPVCHRVPPSRFIIDPRCQEIQEARFMGHRWIRDKDDLMKAKGFNKKLIQNISDDAGLEHGNEPEFNEYNSPSRKEITGYEIWVPEITLPEAQGNPHFNGTLFTMAVSAGVPEDGNFKAFWIRKPRPFYGPHWGPYSMFGVYVVPGQVLPLSPLAATYEQVKELNAHAVSASVGAANYKKFAAFEPGNKPAGEAAKNAAHGEVVPIPNLDQDIKEVTIGGNDAAVYEYLNLLHGRRDRVTGLNEAARGNISGRGTATEHADAASARDSRLALMERMFGESTRQVLDSSGWYHHQSEFIRFRLGQGAAKDLAPRPKSLPSENKAEDIALDIARGTVADPHGLRELPFSERLEVIKKTLKWHPELWFPSEDPTHAFMSLAEISGVEYHELELIIEPMSMARTDQGMLQRRAQDQFALIMQAATIMPQTPWIDWPTLLDKWGNAMNAKDFTEIINMDLLAQAQGIQEQSALAGVAGEGGGGGGGVPGPQAPAPDQIQAARASGRDLSEAAR